MVEKKRSEFAKSFAIWFGIAAVMYGTQVGGSMAAGTYAVGCFATFGGGWLLVFCGIYFLFRAGFSLHALEFIRIYKTTDWNSFYLELYGLNRTDANRILRLIVTAFFDIMSVFSGIIITAATINLFGELMNSIFGVPVMIGRLVAVILYAVLTMYGAGFLRKFNGVMTIGLLVCMIVMIAAVIQVRGDIFFERLGNFEIGMDWSGTTLGAHFMLLISYAFNSANIGTSLCNFSQNIRGPKDSLWTSILLGLLSISAFFMTSCIVLPFLPEMIVDTPILDICVKYLPTFITAFYWVLVVLSVVSTGPSFTYGFARRWMKLWKHEKPGERTKIFILAAGFLLVCYFASDIGLLALVQKGFSTLGSLAAFTIGIPILISCFRMAKYYRTHKKNAGDNT